MPLFSFEGKRPTIHESAFIAPTATIVGDVTIEEGASVWYGAVVRADFSSVVIRAGANVQDGSVIHGGPGDPTEIGSGATVAHNCVVHGSRLGEECMVANGAIVLDGCTIGARSLIAAGAVVTGGTQIPEGMLVMGVPAKVRGPLAGTGGERWVRSNPSAYRQLAQRHLRGVQPV